MGRVTEASEVFICRDLLDPEYDMACFLKYSAFVQEIERLDTASGRFLQKIGEDDAFSITTEEFRTQGTRKETKVTVLRIWVENENDLDAFRLMQQMVIDAAQKTSIHTVIVEQVEGPKLILVDPDQNWWPSRETLLASIRHLRPAESAVPMKNIDGFSLTPIEVPVYSYLRDTKLSFTPQCRLVSDGGIKYRIDFLIFYGGHTFALELDGHDAHKTKDARGRDASRDRFLLQRGITPIRFTGSQIYRDLEGCMKELVDCLTRASTHTI